MKPSEFNNYTNIRDKKSLLKLNDIGLPTKQTEAFRHFNITKLLSKEYSLDFKSNFCPYEKDDGFYTIIINNGIIDTINSDLPDGISFETTNKKEVDTLDSLYYLGEIFLEKQQKIIVKKELDKPLKIVNLFVGEDLFLPTHLTILAEKGVHVEILEVFDDSALKNSLIKINRVLNTHKYAQLNYTKLQGIKQDNNMIVNYIPKLKEGSTCRASSVDLGAGTSLNMFDLILNHKNSIFSFDGIIKITDRQKAGNISSMLHAEGETQSSFICKHILDVEASALFEVQSTVNQEAKFSKTFQNSQTILLDDGPKINAIPQLVLHTDELEAAHGATSGSLDEEALYYLMSRGIEEKMASKILIKAIELQVIDTIENTQIREFALDFLQR